MEGVLLLTLAPLVYQDFKYRRVWLWLLLLFGIMQIAISSYKYGWVQTGYHVLLNVTIIFVISMTVLLYAYFRFRLRKPLIGGGDIVFILLLTPYFPYPFFVVFMLASLLCALVGWSVTVCLYKDASATIPLVSYLGICYAFVIIYNSLFDL